MSAGQPAVRGTAGYQAMALSASPPPTGCAALLDWLAGIIGPIEGDRPFGEDIERLARAHWPPPDRTPAGSSGVSVRSE
jgi:hypothetical protein